MIDPDTMQAIILGLLAVFAGGGVWSWLGTRHKPSIDRADAAVANANETTDKALALAERADAAAARAEARIIALESRLTRWMVWGSDIVARWPIHRQSETPPALPE